jgi:hypothetical protein
MLFKVCSIFFELPEYYAHLVIWSGNSQVMQKLKTLLFGIWEHLCDLIDWVRRSQDACNRKSNQQNLGTIKSSNLCTEIVEFSSPEETAVCNLASIALPRFVREKVRHFMLK